MKLSSLRRSRDQRVGGVSGPARLDRRTKSLVRRLRPGDIAVIDHVDLDRTSATALVEARVAAVVNLAPSISGRYPNLGPSILLDAGIVLIDDVDAQLFASISDGDLIRVDGDGIYRDGELIASGIVQDRPTITAALEAANAGMTSHLEAFTANTVAHLRRERAMLVEGEGVPSTDTALRGRSVVVVAKAFNYRDDLKALKSFIRETRPVLIGVDAGADALLDAGHRPDLVVTSLEDISDRALRAAGEVVVHATSQSAIRGLDRLDRLGLRHTVFVAGGSDEDAAIVLANTHEARLIVTAGSHSSLIEFFDRGRSGMASTFLTRATATSRLVEARAVGQLYRHRISTFLVLLMLVIGIALVAVAVFSTPIGQDWWHDLQNSASDLVDNLRNKLQ